MVSSALAVRCRLCVWLLMCFVNELTVLTALAGLLTGDGTALTGDGTALCGGADHDHRGEVLGAAAPLAADPDDYGAWQLMC